MPSSISSAVAKLNASRAESSPPAPRKKSAPFTKVTPASVARVEQVRRSRRPAGKSSPEEVAALGLVPAQPLGGIALERREHRVPPDAQTVARRARGSARRSPAATNSASAAWTKIDGET